ncbi:hypothetical protein GCM10010191_68660 [Actinomadura vinacea]|uniref:DUF397 domain-containing protein n=1 Tax=Actinomadura vinacea TaxID=115336 RepID=A0ABN3K0E4_9ACTN
MGEVPRFAWRRSSHSTSENCVEVAALTPRVGVRDSKDPDGPKLIFETMAWNAFLRQVKDRASDQAELDGNDREHP